MKCLLRCFCACACFAFLVACNDVFYPFSHSVLPNDTDRLGTFESKTTKELVAMLDTIEGEYTDNRTQILNILGSRDIGEISFDEKALIASAAAGSYFNLISVSKAADKYEEDDEIINILTDLFDFMNHNVNPEICRVILSDQEVLQKLDLKTLFLASYGLLINTAYLSNINYMNSDDLVMRIVRGMQNANDEGVYTDLESRAVKTVDSIEGIENAAEYDRDTMKIAAKALLFPTGETRPDLDTFTIDDLAAEEWLFKFYYKIADWDSANNK